MISYYRFSGVVASVAVLINVFVIWAVMQNIDAAITLPVLQVFYLLSVWRLMPTYLCLSVYEKSLKQPRDLRPAIQVGYKKAFSAIFDANITTILAALILLQFDSGPIRGFAVTLIIGITCSMFTALFMTRYFFSGWVQNPEHKELKMSEWIRAQNFNFLKMAKPAFLLSIGLFLLGAAAFVPHWKSMVGMDFTGGYALTVELNEMKGKNIREIAEHALVKKGLKGQEFQIRTLGRDNFIRIQLGIGIEEKGQPFYQMPHELSGDAFEYDFQKNPRIVWLVQALKNEGLTLKDSQLANLASNWTAMSGQLSDTMRNNAIIALTLALVAILFYIAIRFEWKYAVACARTST